MNRVFLVLVGLVLTALNLTAQEEKTKYLFTLEDVVQLAKDQSLNAIIAKHQFRASYYSFMEFRANFRPKLTLTTSPTTWDKSIQTIPSFDNDGNYVTKEVRANTFTSTAGLALSQNIGLTGGTISLGSDFQRRQNFLEKNDAAATSFTTIPVRLSISQPLNGYNQLRWLKKIEPLRYEEAKQSYIVAMEAVAYRAVENFFGLAIAQVKLKMMKTNFDNTKDLYAISEGRYGQGIIAEDALLQVQLRFMQAESRLNEANIELESRLNQLRTFLGFKDNVEIELLINTEVPNFKISHEEAMSLALEKNPDIIAWKRQILDAERLVEQTKSQSGITLNMDASFGLNKTEYTFKDAYSPAYGDREGIALRVNVPILDWDQSRNRVRNAQSNLEVIETRIQQDEIDFRQTVYLQVTRFNMQEKQLEIAAMADTIAQKGYDISYQRYMLGRGNITELNIADTDKDKAKMDYMDELKTYWNYFYTIRRLTLFDFLTNKPLDEDFENITDD